MTSAKVMKRIGISKLLTNILGNIGLPIPKDDIICEPRREKFGLISTTDSAHLAQ